MALQNQLLAMPELREQNKGQMTFGNNNFRRNQNNNSQQRPPPLRRVRLPFVLHFSLHFSLKLETMTLRVILALLSYWLLC